MRRQYPCYRSSGVEWLGEVPEHWEVKRLEHVASINDDTLSESEDPLRPIAYVDIGSIDSTIGITEMEEMVFEDAPSRARRLVCGGDTIVATVRTYLRAIAQVSAPPPEMVVSTGFAVIRPRRLDPGFASWALREQGIVSEIVARSTGVSYPAISARQIGVLSIPLPPLNEQRAIAEYLDRETERIDALVAKKRQLIERLQEYRTALITRTVTRGLPSEAARAAGLDPSPRLKPSGVEWLGDVPEHWEVRRLSSVVECLDGRRIPLNAEERAERQGDYPYWGANGVLDHLDDSLFDEPLVLLGEDGAPFFARNKRVAFSVSGRIWVNNHAHVLRPRGVQQELLTHLLNITEYAAFIDGSTRDKLTQRDMNGIPILLPPAEEQVAIVDHLRGRVSQLELLADAVHGAIERLQECRTALITAAVTGKVDVREPVAADGS